MTQEQKMLNMERTIKQLNIHETDDFFVGLVLTLYGLEPMYTDAAFAISKTAVRFVHQGATFMEEPIVDGESPRRALLALRRRLLVHAHTVLKGGAGDQND